MTLAAYLKKRGPGALSRLALHAGVSRQTIWRIATGRTRPTLFTARAIALATGGHVRLWERS